MNDNNNETWTPPDKGCMPAHIRKWAPPQCPVKAVIPLVEVATPENLKGLSNCFVYVQSTNTTYYIDNQHRFIVCWSGSVESNNYDLDANVLGLRNQFLIDEANNVVVYYDKLGNYRVLDFDGPVDGAIRLTVNYEGGSEPANWTPMTGIMNSLLSGTFGNKTTVDFLIEDASFTNESTHDTLSLADVFGLLESGRKVILDHVPLGAYYPYSEGNELISAPLFVDGVELNSKTTESNPELPGPVVCYTGGSLVVPMNANCGGTYLGAYLTKDPYNVYSFCVQGFGHFHSNEN